MTTGSSATLFIAGFIISKITNGGLNMRNWHKETLMLQSPQSQPPDESLQQYAVRLSDGTQYILAASDEHAAWCALELSNRQGLELYDVQPMSGNKGYFPNKWRKIKDIDSSYFEQIPYEEVMEWKIAGWELTHNVCCVIRATNLQTNKVREYVYQRRHAAESKIQKFLNARTHELVICDAEAVYYVHPKMLSDDYND
jgi:hypothetical protein|tara:strand:+ start:945 stop:1538 length:594 start_codon:yes stop_codon:yes gene_type:complete